MMERRSRRLSQRLHRLHEEQAHLESRAIQRFLEAVLPSHGDDDDYAELELPLLCEPAAFDLFHSSVLPLPFPLLHDSDDGSASDAVEDFDLPSEWTRRTAQYKYRLLKHNQYRAPLQRPATNVDSIPPCVCKPGTGCSDSCVNRGLFMECPVGRCNAVPDGGYDCGNSRIQLRQFAEVEVFETKDRGFALRAKHPLPEGTLIAEYLGEVITLGECMERMNAMEATDDFYFAGLGGGLILDARAMGSEARFANHSCEPNAELQKWNVLGEPRIALVATREVEEGEEITYNYNYHMDGLNAQVMRQVCLCGSAACSGMIGGRVKLSARDEWIARAEKMLVSLSERSIRLDAIKLHLSRGENPELGLPESHPMLTALRNLCDWVSEWQSRVKARLQPTAAELSVGEVEALLQEATGKPRTDGHLMLQKALEKYKQLSKQLSAVYQQVTGKALSEACGNATEPVEQELHWDYAVQLLKDMEGSLPMRIEAADFVITWLLKFCEPVIKVFASAFEPSSGKDAELQPSESSLSRMISTVFTAYGRDPVPLRCVMAVVEALHSQLDLLRHREIAMRLPKNQIAKAKRNSDVAESPSDGAVEGAGTTRGAELEADVDKLYCFCRLPEASAEERTMVLCGTCEDWFHPECVSIHARDIPRNVDFMCPLCAHMEGMSCSLSDPQLVAWRYQKGRKPDKAQPRSQLFPPYLLSIQELIGLEEQLSITPIVNSPLHICIDRVKAFVADWKARVQDAIASQSAWQELSAPAQEIQYLRRLLALFFEPVLLRVAIPELAELRAHIWGFVTSQLLEKCNIIGDYPTLEELDRMLKEGSNLPQPACDIVEQLEARQEKACSWMQTVADLKYQNTSDEALRELMDALDAVHVDMSEDFCFARFRNHCLLRPSLQRTQESEEVYCWCKQEDNGQPMVCCDRCQNWFHAGCIGIHRKKTLKSLKGYYCVACCDELGKNYPHAWQSDSEKLLAKRSRRTKRKRPTSSSVLLEDQKASTTAQRDVKKEKGERHNAPRIAESAEARAAPNIGASKLAAQAADNLISLIASVSTERRGEENFGSTDKASTGAVDPYLLPYLISMPSPYYYDPRYPGAVISRDSAGVEPPIEQHIWPPIATSPLYAPVMPFAGYWMSGPSPPPNVSGTGAAATSLPATEVLPPSSR